MKHGRAGLTIARPTLWVVTAALAGAIFLADTITNLEIAVAVLHVAVVLVSVKFGRPRVIALVGTGCGILTIASFFLTQDGVPEIGSINCALSLLAIGAATYLAIKIKTADAAARQAEAHLAHMARVTTMGTLTASIAHEVNQPLAAVAANGHAAIRWLSAVPPNWDEAMHALDRIVRDAGRAGEVIEHVRRLVTRTMPSPEQADLVEVIEEVLALIQDEIRTHRIQVDTELSADLPVVLGDRIQLQQVILNFVVNAIEAMSAVSGPRKLLIGAAADSTKATISVRDTGISLAPAALDQVFDAFYTTKPTGMGMGLAISRSIIEAHGGTVYAAANIPRGMVFGFTLPLDVEEKG